MTGVRKMAVDTVKDEQFWKILQNFSKISITFPTFWARTSFLFSVPLSGHDREERVY